MPAPKPETMSQARTFDRVVRNAGAAGLCPTCAPQLGWAAQAGTGGFSSVKPPCPACTVVMIGWPLQRPNGWRTPRGTLSAPATWAEFTPTGRVTSPAADPEEV
jgi:hypothetical protein